MTTPAHAGASAPDLDIPLTSVESTNIDAFGYSAAHQVLDVRFKNGQTHRYTGVPKEAAHGFKDSHSKGGFFAKSIRGVYPSKRLDKR